jgi:hypothetical protein
VVDSRARIELKKEEEEEREERRITVDSYSADHEGWQ